MPPYSKKMNVMNQVRSYIYLPVSQVLIFQLDVDRIYVTWEALHSPHFLHVRPINLVAGRTKVDVSLKAPRCMHYKAYILGSFKSSVLEIYLHASIVLDQKGKKNNRGFPFI